MEGVWAAVIDEHNRIRKEEGLEAVEGDLMIHSDAQKHADYLASSGRFRRTSMFGKYPCCNITRSFQPEKVKAATDSMLKLENQQEFPKCLKPDINRIGVGIAKDVDQSCWVMAVFYDSENGQRRESVG